MPQNGARAVALATTACDGDYLEGCVVLGVIYQTVPSIEDPAKAATYYEKACSGGDGAGCFNLSLLYRFGTGVAADPDKMRQLLQRACKLGQSQACEP